MAYTDSHLYTALSIILKQHPPSELMKHTDINITVQGLLPYTGQCMMVVFLDRAMYFKYINLQRDIFSGYQDYNKYVESRDMFCYNVSQVDR